MRLNYSPRWMLFAAALWNYCAALGGLLIGLSPVFAKFVGLKGSIDSLAWELFAACVLVFGIGYHWAAANPARHRNLVKLGTIGKPLVFAACLWNAYCGRAPLLFALGGTGDLLFGILFLHFLAQNRDMI